MYKLTSFKQNNDNLLSPFMLNIKSKWDEIHESNVLRYKVDNLQEKVIGGNYLLQLNPNRGTNRRTPEHIDNIRQAFDGLKFNFTMVSEQEIIFSIDDKGEEHRLIVNVSPISHYHSLLCPSVNKKLPQVVTAESLSLLLDIMFTAQDRDLKIGFNSLCALASVNHLHYHLFIEKHTLPVELVKWKQIKGPLHCTLSYPVPAFCFEVKKDFSTSTTEIYKLIEFFLENSIAHNILISMKSDNAAVYVWPRKSTVGVKQLTEFNVAVCELSGWFPVYSEEAFHRLQTEDLENEIRKWKLDNFESICKQIELLY